MSKNKFSDAMKGSGPKAVKKITSQVTAADVAVAERLQDESEPVWKTPRTRKGRKAITSYVSTDAHKQLKLLAIEEDKTIKELMDEAVEGLFRGYGKTPIN